MLETLLVILLAVVIFGVIVWVVQQFGLPRPIYLAVVVVLAIVFLLFLLRHLGIGGL